MTETARTAGGPRRQLPDGDDRPAASSLHWAALGDLLRSKDLRVIRGDERRRFLSLWEGIAERERGLDDRLFLGIIGGTGVGKSTLINAVAGAPISRSGDRRPTTSRVVLYRHRRSSLPEDFPREDLAFPEAVHEEDGMERMVVLDFPDFDSVESDHAAVLRRLLPRLDVLLVLVDDEKYGDLRLFEVLRSLPQAPRNLHFVLNKVDRLAERYGERWPEVAGEILADLKGKLAAHGGLASGSPWLIAASARTAFERRSGAGREGGGTDPGRPEGDFGAILDLLLDYRAAKRRRAAKEANLDARKAALARAARSAGLDPGMKVRAEAAGKALRYLSEELESSLAGIAAEAIGPRQMKRLYSGALKRSGRRLAFPLGWLISFFRGKGGSSALEPEDLSRLARSHYRSFRDGLKAAERELAGEIADVAGPACGPLAPPAPREDRGRDLYQDLEVRLSRALRRGRLRAHLLPALLVLLGLWSALYPSIVNVAEGLKRGEPIAWGEVLLNLSWALVKALSPLGVLSFLAALAAAYALSAYLGWRRIRNAVDGAVEDFEKALREEARAEASAVFRRIAAPLEAWERERLELEKALGG